jgi:prepilin-type N-terminal cleavage/methylation domain-containing protein
MSAGRTRAPARGYTMIEVMMALGLLAVGATGIIAMEKAAVVGNASARGVATATALAQRWIERLRADAMLWNNTTPLSDIGETRWLKTVTLTPGIWTLPAIVPNQASPFADPLGADIIYANDPSPVGYCTHIMYRQITPKMINATVRVTWRRDISPIDCADPGLFDPATDAGRYGAIYLTTGFMTQERPQ